MGEHVDVDATLGTAAAPAETTVTRWAGCRPGGVVELWTVPGGGHTPRVSAAFPGAVLDFLEAHTKP
jgi:poly(3-hydroxybutyrate) depolymerase